MKSSEVIALAVNDERYLNGLPYLCFVMTRLEMERKITLEEHIAAKEQVKASINYFAFLRTYLRVHGLIPNWADDRHPEFAPAAHTHWNALIQHLKEQDL